MIALAILGLLSNLHFSHTDAGLVLWALVSLRVLLLDRKVALLFNLATLGLYSVGLIIPLPIHLGLFVAGWIFQLVGHSKYERNRPAFLTNLQHLLIGPVWVFMRCVKLR